MSYRPGLHIISEFSSDSDFLLKDIKAVKFFFDNQIAQFELSMVGEIYHSFEGAGYTGTICLTESHIAFHTWPEYNLVTFDVFLSNFKRENDITTRKIHENTLLFFNATNVKTQEIRR